MKLIAEVEGYTNSITLRYEGVVRPDMILTVIELNSQEVLTQFGSEYTRSTVARKIKDEINKLIESGIFTEATWKQIGYAYDDFISMQLKFKGVEKFRRESEQVLGHFPPKLNFKNPHKVNPGEPSEVRVKLEENPHKAKTLPFDGFGIGTDLSRLVIYLYRINTKERMEIIRLKKNSIMVTRMLSSLHTLLDVNHRQSEWNEKRYKEILELFKPNIEIQRPFIELVHFVNDEFFRGDEN